MGLFLPNNLLLGHKAQAVEQQGRATLWRRHHCQEGPLSDWVVGATPLALGTDFTDVVVKCSTAVVMHIISKFLFEKFLVR